MAEEIGRIQKLPFEIKEIEWSIDDYFSVIDDTRYSCYESPTFSFPGVHATWNLKYYPRQTYSAQGYVGLYLHRNVFLKYQVEYTYSLRKSDGSRLHIFSRIMAKDTEYTTQSESDFIKKEELLNRKYELVPNNTLTIICTLKFMTEITHSTQKSVLDEIRISKITNPSLQLEKIKGFLTDGEFCDVTLQVKNKEFKAHKMILASRSPVFESYFKHETLEKQTGVINIPDCDPESFKEFLEYLYCGELDNISFRSCFELYKTADKYDVKELKMWCIDSIKHKLNVENFCDVIVFAEERGDANLFAIAQDFFNGRLGEIFISSEWKSLLESNYNLANKLLIEMASCIQGTVKRPRLE